MSLDDELQAGMGWLRWSQERVGEVGNVWVRGWLFELENGVAVRFVANKLALVKAAKNYFNGHHTISLAGRFFGSAQPVS